MVSRFVWRVCFPIAWLCIAGACPRESVAQPPSSRNTLAVVQEKHRDHFQEFVSELEQIAEFCQGKSLSEGVDRIQGRLNESRLISPDAPSLKTPALPSMPANAPLPTFTAMALQARATTSIKSRSSGWMACAERCCSTRN